MSIPKTHHVIQISETSPSFDVLKYIEVPTPQITSPTDVIVKNKYAGINLIESYFRKGIYPVQLPVVLGREAAGVVAAVGSDVKNFKVGDKIAYLSSGTFAQYTKISDSHAQFSNLGENATDEDLKFYGSALVGALTPISFVEEAHKVQKGEFILVWAAAGGVGGLLVQLAKAKGARVIAIALTKEKLELASSLGAEFLINHKTDDIVAKVKEFTNGQGVAASFDSVGKDSFETSLEALALKGSFISYGNATGQVPPLSINRLTPKNIRLLRPSLFGYVSTKEAFDHYFGVLRKLIELGTFKFPITKVYPLSEYPEATRALESSETTGKLTLEIPQ